MKYQLQFTMTLLCILCITLVNAQRITGEVRDDKGLLLPYASIMVKGTTIGVSANNNAAYSFSLKPGNYTLVCQHIGYQTIERNIQLEKDAVIDFVMKPQTLAMSEIVVSDKGENPAYGIIRQAIIKRELYNRQVEAFQCELYSKDVIKLRGMPKKLFGNTFGAGEQKSMANSLKLDSTGKGMIYLSEAMSTVFSKQPDLFKLKVNSSRVSGSNRFGFTFPVFVNLYQNNVDALGGGINSRGFVSPIADGALRFYKYKMLGTFEENGKMVYSIRVMPRRNYEPLFSGTININDENFSIHSFDLIVTKESQLELLDTLKITQLHVPLDQNIFRVKNQLLSFSLKFFDFDLEGKFLSVYSNYQINPVFEKGTFDKVVIKYDTAVDKRPKAYWDTIRPVPLNLEEVRDYHVKDSLFIVAQDSIARNNNIDSLRKHQGKLKWNNIIMTGIDRKHYGNKSRYDWGMDPLLFSFNYNSVEGLAQQLTFFKEKKYRDKGLTLLIKPGFRYGYSNTHFNTWADVALMQRKKSAKEMMNRYSWFFSGGKKVAQYNSENPVEPLVNTFSTLLAGDNEMKIYEKYYGGAGFMRKYQSGAYWSVKAVYEDRMTLNNTTDYTLYRKDTIKLTSNIPECRNIHVDEGRHQAAIVDVNVSFTIGQQYIELPDRKLALGSKYPTFNIGYTKGFNGILGSDVNFDKWCIDILDEFNMKLGGAIKYKVTMGGFINSESVFLQDYKHFNSNSIRARTTYLNGFQLMGSYINSNKAPFYLEGHLEHHANGFITNKIPFINKWGWNLVSGANAYYINPNDHYQEVFVGLENILKLLRVDFVTAYQNGKYHHSAFVIGTGGLLGSQFGSSGVQFSGRKVEMEF